MVQTYGLTETASQVATLAPEDARRKVGSAGKPLMGTRVRVEPDGEILVDGPTVSPGYLHQPPRVGWLRTGDLGRLDEDGYLYVLDRRDDLIVSGGENVYPAEVEAALRSHPSVADAGVRGLADPRMGPDRRRRRCALRWRLHLPKTCAPISASTWPATKSHAESCSSPIYRAPPQASSSAGSLFFEKVWFVGQGLSALRKMPAATSA